MANSPRDLANAPKPTTTQTASTAPASAATEDTAPVLNTTAPAAAAVVETPPAKPVATTDEATVIMQKLIASYIEFNTGYLVSAEQKKQAAEKFNAIVRHALNRPTAGCLTALYTFFKEQRTKVMAPTVAFTGHQFRSPGMAQKVSFLYAVMYEVTEPKPGKLDTSKIRDVLGGEFAEFFSKLLK